MIIVTGGLGFIGSNLVHALNQSGRTDILVVDDFTNGKKFVNIADAVIEDYMDKDELLRLMGRRHPLPGRVEAIFHQGACSATTEWNGKLVMDSNFSYSKTLFHYAQSLGIPFLYASSASVYGSGRIFEESPAFEQPINMYAYSKTLFDRYVRRYMVATTSQVVGLRYFNVYGPREQHKESMASVAFHLHQQLAASGVVRLFSGSDGYGPGEQQRDFVYVDDVVDVLLWFVAHPSLSGIFNVGTGKSQSFNEVAQAVLAYFGHGSVEYMPFPEHLQGCYQSFTEADITRLRAVGYRKAFRPVEAGVPVYMRWLEQQAQDGKGKEPDREALGIAGN